MSAPNGKAFKVVSAHAPWKMDERQRKPLQINKTQQEEIDICLRCKQMKCTGECYEIRTFDRSQRWKIKVPSGFEAMARRSDVTQKSLARYYGVSVYTIQKWSKEAGITKEKRPLSALAER